MADDNSIVDEAEQERQDSRRNVNLDKHLIAFMQDAAFFAEISRFVKKRPSTDIPTLGVCYDSKRDELQLLWNPKFIAKLNDAEVRGVLLHEFYHIVFGHITSRKRTPHMLWNIAADLAINSLITLGTGNDDKYSLPSFGLMPGKRPEMPVDREMTETEKKLNDEMAKLIESFPPMMASEWYFKRLHDMTKEMGIPDELLSGAGSYTIDVHDWDDIPEEMREYVESRIKEIIKGAANKADQNANGWGNVPADVRSSIRRYVNSVVDWRLVLRQFVGNIVRGSRTSSIKRINRKYPYIHPGTKRGYVAKLLVGIDMSGSVDDEMLASFFAELTGLTKRVDVTILPFDCSADVRDAFEWKKGARPELTRTKQGGTDFSAPTRVFNDPANRGRWNGCLILTDGQAGVPEASRGKRGWVLGNGCKLAFETNELKIFMSKDEQIQGAWR
jgi:predicted metal-dependent peptidase